MSLFLRTDALANRTPAFSRLVTTAVSAVVVALISVSGGALSAAAVTDPYAYPEEEQPGGGGDAICIDDADFSYTWDGPAGTGSVVVTGGAEGQPLCFPLFVRAASYNYDTPVDGNTPSWPQTLVGVNDYTIDTVGTHPFQVPGTNCGQDDVYATFDYAGFDDLAVPDRLLGPSNPYEPQFLHKAVPTEGGGYTIYHDDSAICGQPGGGQLDSAQLAIAKKASNENPAVGQPFDYTLEVSNTGSADAGAITVTDMLPEHVEIGGGISAGDWTVDQHTDATTGRTVLTFTLPSLAAGETADLITIPVVVNAPVAEPLDNSATACLDDSDNEVPCVSDNVVVTVQSAVFTAAPICVKDVPAANYSIQLTNVDLTANPNVIFEWVTVGGEVVQTVTIPTQAVMNGTLTWPGATFDTNGNATDWPGWTHNGTTWVQDATDLGANLRPAAVLRATIAGVQSAQMDYPGGPCANPPQGGQVGSGGVGQQPGGQVGSGGVGQQPGGQVLSAGVVAGQQSGQLALTGTEQDGPLASALALLAFGIAFVVIGAIRRKRVVAND